MKKLLHILLLNFFVFFTFTPLMGQGSVTVGGFSVSYPSSMVYEEGQRQVSWSVQGGSSYQSGDMIELLIDGENGRDIALFSNYQKTFSSTWNGATNIMPRSIGKFTLKIKIWRNGNVFASRDLAMEIKSNVVYSIGGSASISIGERTTYTLNSTTHVKSTRWTVSNSLASIENQQAGSVTLVPRTIGDVTLSAEITLVSNEVKNISKTVNIKASLDVEANKTIVCNGETITARITNDPANSTSIVWSSPNMVLQSGQGTRTAVFMPNAGFNGYTSISVRTNTTSKSIQNIWVGPPKINEEQFAYEIDDRKPFTFPVAQNNIQGPHDNNYSWEYFSGSTEYTVINNNPDDFTIKSTLSPNMTGQIVFKRIVRNSCGEAAEYHTININRVDWSKTLKLKSEKRGDFYFTIEGYDELKREYPNATVTWSNPPAVGNVVGQLTVLSDNAEAKYSISVRVNPLTYQTLSGYTVRAQIYNDGALLASFEDNIDTRDRPYLYDPVGLGGSVIEPYRDLFYFTIENLRSLGSKEDGYEFDEIVNVYTTPYPQIFGYYIYGNYIEFMVYDYGFTYTPDLGMHKESGVRMGAVVRLKNGEQIRIETDPYDVIYYDPDKDIDRALQNMPESPVFSVKVYSLYSTKVLYRADNIERFSINETNLEPGIYVIEKTDGNGVITKEKVSKRRY